MFSTLLVGLKVRTCLLWLRTTVRLSHLGHSPWQDPSSAFKRWEFSISGMSIPSWKRLSGDRVATTQGFLGVRTLTAPIEG